MKSGKFPVKDDFFGNTRKVSNQYNFRKLAGEQQKVGGRVAKRSAYIYRNYIADKKGRKVGV